MILENNPDFSYMRLLVADYHLEYPLEALGGAKVELVWNPYNIESIAADLHTLIPLWQENGSDRLRELVEELFGPLEQKYNGHYEPGMNLWVVQGNLSQLYQVWERHLQNCMIAPDGDDDTYDYWPNAVDMLTVMAQDILELAPKDEVSNYYTNHVLMGLKGFIGSIEAQEGTDWEVWEAQAHKDAIVALIS